MDREIRSLGAVSAGGESSYTLSYWVILKRKFGVPRNSFVHPKKKKKNQWEFSTWIILWYRLQENPCWIICFPKATFKVQISSPEQIPTARTNRTAKTLTFASMWLPSFLDSRTFSERGTPEVAGSVCCTMATSEISGGWVITPRCEPDGLLNLLHSNGLQKFCPSQKLVMGIFLRQEEKAEGQRK